MVKKLFFILLMGVFVLSINNPILAQEEKEAEDIEEFSLEELLNVEITTAGKKAEKISEIPASVVIITREDIENYGYSNLVEILEGIPGLYYIDDLSYAGGFGIRGFWTFTARNIVVLVNDFKMYEGINSSYELNNIQIPVEAIDRIEVIRGPMSVMYGSGAFFGVINIRTNIIEEDKANSILAVSFGNEQSYKAAARFAGGKEDLKFVANAGLFETEGPDELLSTMASNPATYAGLPDTTEGRLEDSYKFFNLYGSYKGLYGNFVFNSRPTEEYFFLPSASDGYKVTYDYVNAAVGYKKDLSETVSIDLKFNYGKNTIYRQADYFYANYRGTEYLTSTFFDLEAVTVFSVPKLNLVLGANYQIITDAHTSLNHVLFGLLQWGARLDNDSNIETRSIFAQGDYQISNNFKFVAGVRFEQQLKYDLYHTSGPADAASEVVITPGEYDKQDVEIIPRVAAIFSINENNYLKFMFGKAINRPGFYQNDQQVASGYEPLESEDISTFELNYLGNFSAQLNVSLSVFYNTLKNLMVRTHYFDEQGEYHSFFGNEGELVTKGVELSILFRPSQKFRLELSGTYQDTSDQREGYKELTVAYSPSILGYFKAVVNITKDVSLAVTGNYVDEMQTFWEGHWDPALGGGRVAQKVDSYFNLGANIRFKNLFGKGFYLNIRGSNLLNKLILYPQYTNNAGWADKGSLGPGLLIIGTLGWKF